MKNRDDDNAGRPFINLIDDAILAMQQLTEVLIRKIRDNPSVAGEISKSAHQCPDRFHPALSRFRLIGSNKQDRIRDLAKRSFRKLNGHFPEVSPMIL